MEVVFVLDCRAVTGLVYSPPEPAGPQLLMWSSSECGTVRRIRRVQGALVGYRIREYHSIFVDTSGRLSLEMRSKVPTTRR